MNKLFQNHGFHLTALVLIAVRFLHFGQELDLPHDWRQADTAYYCYDFYKNGIDLLRPAVCWMGGHATLALECPIPEAIVAQLWQFTGVSIPAARAVFLLFFLCCVYFFHQLIKLLYGAKVAGWASLVYLALPLSFFYSRAIHIDFFALSFTHAMMYYTLRSIKNKSNSNLLWSSLLAIPAFVVKVPYIFYFSLPIIAYAWQQKTLVWFVLRSFIYLIPVFIFLLWHQHATYINSQAPDWSFILNYRKFVDNSNWYFGSLAQRLSLYNWKILGSRIVLEVFGPGGIILGLIGLWQITWQKRFAFAHWWMLGLTIYLLIFFNLNKVHNYYQLPFLGIAALLIAFGLQLIHSKWGSWINLLFCLFLLTNFLYAETQYYEVPTALDEMGGQIAAHTPEDALVIVSYQNFDCKNPRLLYRSLRKGWSIEEKAVSSQLIQQLLQAGATHWAYIGEKSPIIMSEIPFSSQLVLPLQFSADSVFLFQFE